MKNSYVKRIRLAGGIFGTVLAAGLIFGPAIASAYVDENLVTRSIGDGIWYVTPAGDSERDADTLQFVIDLADEGDTIHLGAGAFDFGPNHNEGLILAKTVTVEHDMLTIVGETTLDPFGAVDEYRTQIKGSFKPLEAHSPVVTIKGIWIEPPLGPGYPYPKKARMEGVMMNMSVRVSLASGEVTIPGLVITEGQQVMMFRAVGQALADYGVENPTPDPKIELYKGNVLIAESCDWCSCEDKGAKAGFACELTGAFDLPEGSTDAVLVWVLERGAYTVQVSDESGGSGEVLVEMYTVPIE